MLDADLAHLYEVETKVLNKAVKRHLDRFPDDFMFQLTEEEAKNLRCQIGTSKKQHGGRRYLPYAFTEQGVAMLSSILNSPRAVKVNIEIMRAFVRLRKLLASHYTAKGEPKGDTRFVRITDINLNGELIDDDPKYINLSNNSRPYLLKKGDVLIARTGASYGKTIVFDLDKQCVFASFLIRLSFSYDMIRYYLNFSVYFP